jgi:predicted CXXCH cytochrome family protein
MPHRLVLMAALAAESVILRPEPRSIVPAGPLSVIAKTEAEILLDGKAIAAQRPAPGAAHATLEIAPGKHTLSAGGVTIEFAAGSAPAGWKPFRAHPPASACGACHTSGTWEFEGAEACLACHDAAAFAKPHTHNAEVLNECQLCHLPHGSTEKAHLKFPKSTACKQCHG